MPTTQAERADFANRMKFNLSMMNNYGFKIANQKRPFGDDRDKLVTWSGVEKLRAIKELYVRLKVFEIKGGKSDGTIEFPEAGRQIEYRLTDNNISNCFIKLKAVSDRSEFIYEDDDDLHKN